MLLVLQNHKLYLWRAKIGNVYSLRYKKQVHRSSMLKALVCKDISTDNMANCHTAAVATHQFSKTCHDVLPDTKKHTTIPHTNQTTTAQNRLLAISTTVHYCTKAKVGSTTISKPVYSCGYPHMPPSKMQTLRQVVSCRLHTAAFLNQCKCE